MIRAERERLEIEQQTAEFLAKGGTITELPNTLPKEKEFEFRGGKLRYREQKRYEFQVKGGQASRKPMKPKKKPKRVDPIFDGLKSGEGTA